MGGQRMYVRLPFSIKLTRPTKSEAASIRSFSFSENDAAA